MWKCKIVNHRLKCEIGIESSDSNDLSTILLSLISSELAQFPFLFVGLVPDIAIAHNVFRLSHFHFIVVYITLLLTTDNGTNEKRLTTTIPTEFKKQKTNNPRDEDLTDSKCNFSMKDYGNKVELLFRGHER